MSADNWTYCPFCKMEADAKAEDKLKKAQDSYGKVPAEVYLKNLREAEVRQDLPTTLREDWDIGIREGENWFTVDYSCSCDACNRRFSFKHEQKPDWKP